MATTRPNRSAQIAAVAASMSAKKVSKKKPPLHRCGDLAKEAAQAESRAKELRAKEADAKKQNEARYAEAQKKQSARQKAEHDEMDARHKKEDEALANRYACTVKKAGRRKGKKAGKRAAKSSAEPASDPPERAMLEDLRRPEGERVLSSAVGRTLPANQAAIEALWNKGMVRVGASGTLSLTPSGLSEVSDAEKTPPIPAPPLPPPPPPIVAANVDPPRPPRARRPRKTDTAQDDRPVPVEKASARTVARRASPSKATAPNDSQCEDACHLTLAGSWCGRAASVVLPSETGSPRVLRARFCLTEAENLIPSHDAQTFAPRKDYPARTQERRYETDVAEQVKVATIAQSIVPRLVQNTNAGGLDGTPVVTPSGIVLGGNGRTMAIQRHYLAGKSELRAHLVRHAADFGVSPADLKKYKHPVIVRVIESSDPAEWPRLVRDLNERLAQSMDARAEMVSLGRQFNDEGMELLAGGLADDDLGDWLRSRASVPFINYLRRRGIITSNNAARLVGADGLLSDDGKDALEKLLAGAVLPDATLLDAAGPELRRTLARGAPHVLAAAAAGDEWDLRPALAAAVEGLIEARANGLSPAQFIRQVSLVARPIDTVPRAQELFALLSAVAGAPVQWARAMRRYAELAAQNPKGQTSLIAPMTVDEALAIASRETTARRTR